MLRHLGQLNTNFKINAADAGIPQASNAVITNILNAVYFWTGILAVIVIIVAGFYYVTSANNSDRLTRAKNAILYAVIGLIVVLIAFFITNFIIKGVGS